MSTGPYVICMCQVVSTGSLYDLPDTIWSYAGRAPAEDFGLRKHGDNDAKIRVYTCARIRNIYP